MTRFMPGDRVEVDTSRREGTWAGKDERGTVVETEGATLGVLAILVEFDRVLPGGRRLEGETLHRRWARELHTRKLSLLELIAEAAL